MSDEVEAIELCGAHGADGDVVDGGVALDEFGADGRELDARFGEARWCGLLGGKVLVSGEREEEW